MRSGARWRSGGFDLASALAAPADLRRPPTMRARTPKASATALAAEERPQAEARLAVERGDPERGAGHTRVDRRRRDTPGGASAAPRLMVSGSSAEQPSPARPKATAPAAVDEAGTSEIAMSARPITQGRRRNVVRAGSQRAMVANRIRPAVAAAQNAVRATDASPAGAFSTPCM